MIVDFNQLLDIWTKNVSTSQEFVEKVLNRKTPLNRKVSIQAQKIVEADLKRANERGDFVYKHLSKLMKVRDFIEEMPFKESTLQKTIETFISTLKEKAACFPDCLRVNPIPSVIAEYLLPDERIQLKETIEIAPHLLEEVKALQNLLEEIFTGYTFYSLEEFSPHHPTSLKNMRLLTPLIEKFFREAASYLQIQFFTMMDKELASSRDKANFWLEILHSLPKGMTCLAMPVWEDAWHAAAWRSGHVQSAIMRLDKLEYLEIHPKEYLVPILWNHRQQGLRELKITYSRKSGLIEALDNNSFLKNLRSLTLAGEIPIESLAKIIKSLDTPDLEKLTLDIPYIPYPNNTLIQMIKSNPRLQKLQVLELPHANRRVQLKEEAPNARQSRV